MVSTLKEKFQLKINGQEMYLYIMNMILSIKEVTLYLMLNIKDNPNVLIFCVPKNRDQNKVQVNSTIHEH